MRECNVNDARILGNDTFAAKLLGNIRKQNSRMTVDELVNKACQQFSATHDQLYSASRCRELSHVRAWTAHQAITLRITSLSHIAHLFGRTEAALRQNVKHHFNYP